VSFRFSNITRRFRTSDQSPCGKATVGIESPRAESVSLASQPMNCIPDRRLYAVPRGDCNKRSRDEIPVSWSKRQVVSMRTCHRHPSKRDRSPTPNSWQVFVVDEVDTVPLRITGSSNTAIPGNIHCGVLRFPGVSWGEQFSKYRLPQPRSVTNSIDFNIHLDHLLPSLAEQFAELLSQSRPAPLSCRPTGTIDEHSISRTIRRQTPLRVTSA